MTTTTTTVIYVCKCLFIIAGKLAFYSGKLNNGFQTPDIEVKDRYVSSASCGIYCMHAACKIGCHK